MKTQVGQCPKCGAAIYMPSAWYGINNPPVEYTCNCNPQSVTTTNANGSGATYIQICTCGQKCPIHSKE